MSNATSIAAARKYFKHLGVTVDIDRNGLADFDDMLAEPDEPLEWLVDGLLPKAAVALLAGKAGVGKSVLARNLAASIAAGEEFLGHSCRTGPVVWVSVGEEHRATFKRHMKRLLPAGAGRRLKYLETLPDAKERDTWLFNVLEAERPSLVIIDTIVRFLDIVESTNYGVVSSATQRILDTCRRYDCAHLWLHHTNNAGGVHGSGTWERVPDLVLLYSQDTEGVRFLRMNKSRDDIRLPATAIEYDVDSGRAYAHGTRFELDVARAEQAILDAAKTGKREDVSRCGVNREAGRRALDNLVDRGLYLLSHAGRTPIYRPAESELPFSVNGSSLSSHDTTQSIYKPRARARIEEGTIQTSTQANSGELGRAEANQANGASRATQASEDWKDEMRAFFDAEEGL